MASRALATLAPQFPDLEIHRVDVTLRPKTAWRAGVTMIPCLQAGDRQISGILLSKERIRAFLAGLGETTAT